MIRFCCVLILVVFGQCLAMAEDGAGQLPSLSVTGHAEIEVEPDQAVIQLGVREEAPTAAEAQSGVNRIVQKVLAAIEALPLDPRQIQTSQLSLEPVYGDARSRREAEEPRILGYRASYTLSIETRDLTKISPIIDLALEAGANQLRGIRFGLSDEKSARKEALRQAVADAIEKAEVVARAAGARLEQILAIVEGGAVVRPPMMGRSAVMAAEMGGPPTPVMPGQVAVGGQVTIRYQISQE